MNTRVNKELVQKDLTETVRGKWGSHTIQLEGVLQEHPVQPLDFTQRKNLGPRGDKSLAEVMQS